MAGDFVLGKTLGTMMKRVGIVRTAASVIGIIALILLAAYRYKGLVKNPDSPPDTGLETVAQQFEMMGTFVDIRIYGPEGDREKMHDAIVKAREAMGDYVHIVNRYEEDSEISEVNRKAGIEPVKVSPIVFETLKASKRMGNLSGGAFDVTFLPVGKLWSLKPENMVIPDEAAIQEARKLVDYREMILDETAGTAFLTKKGMLLDLGGIAKGTAVDIAIKSLKESGYENGLVNAGGDIYAMGLRMDGTPWKVGIQNPREKGKMWKTVLVSNRSVVTSGDYERMVIIGGKRYHHIIDPKTGRPTEGVISVTIVNPKAEEADALATSVFVLGVEKGLHLIQQIPDTEALIIDAEEKEHYTSGFQKMVDPGKP